MAPYAHSSRVKALLPFPYLPDFLASYLLPYHRANTRRITKLPVQLPIELLDHIVHEILLSSYAKLPKGESRRAAWSSISGVTLANSVFREVALRAWFSTFHVQTFGDFGYLRKNIGEESQYLSAVRTLQFHVPLSSRSPLPLSYFPSLQSIILTGGNLHGYLTPTPSIYTLNVDLLSHLPPTVTRLQLPVSSLESIGSLAGLTRVPQILHLSLVLEGGDYTGRESVRFPVPLRYRSTNELADFIWFSLSSFPSLQTLKLPHTLVPDTIISHYLSNCDRPTCDTQGWCHRCLKRYARDAAEAELRATQRLAQEWDDLRRVEWGYWFVVRDEVGIVSSAVDVVRWRGEIQKVKRERAEVEKVWMREADRCTT